MHKRFTVLAAICFATGSLVLGGAEAGAGEGHGGGFGGGHPSGGFGGGHIGGLGGGPRGGIGSTAPPVLSSPGGGQFRLSAVPHLGGFGAERLGSTRLTAPRYGALGGRYYGGLTARGYGAPRSNRGRLRRAGTSQFAQQSRRQKEAAEKGFAGRHERGQVTKSRFPNSPARLEKQRSSVAALRRRRNAAEAQREPAPDANERGPLNNAAFRRGNGFESARFGGRRWRGREGRFRHFWVGGIFWPYLFGDYFSYAFWPDDYDSPFWAYGPDAILWGALWPYNGYESDFYGGDDYADTGAANAGGSEQLAALCSGFAPGVTDLPLQRLEQIVEPTPGQRAALDDLKAAAAKASRILQTACPEQVPLTPVARLDAMEQRLEAMQQAVTIIRGPLERLYELLSGEQIGRLENAAANPAADKERSPAMNIAELCSGETGLTNVPADEIARAISLTGEQQFNLDKLKKASEKAANDLRASCPAIVPRPLNARLDIAKRRITALIQAIETIRPALGTFYATLSDQQRLALSSQAGDDRSARR